MRNLIAGERAPVSGECTFALAGSDPDCPALALIALEADRQASPAFPPIDGVTREMRPAARFEEAHRLWFDPGRVPAQVERLLLVAFDRGNRPIASPLTLEGGDLRFAVDLRGRDDAAVILIECYRHQGAWRLAANGQGFAMGLSAIAGAHGIDHEWVQRLIPRLRPPERESGDGHDRAGGSGTSSGSGVAIGHHHILTNAHVVDGARAVTVHAGGRPIDAAIVFADPRNDLALLRVEVQLPETARFRAQVGLHLGEDIVALGFPLQGLLGTGPQASAGNIAALCGIGNDSTVFQFTAPIASGNSGGPILDMAGHLVGLVSSSLNLDRIRQSGGSAENINFGIKGAIILSFLDSFGMELPVAGPDPRIVGRAAVVRQARETIARITCEC
ncbi:trypsin-like peptidase domain-containing protein [Novosphingobium album (ex Liu et al. 2023)]|uniref:Trypsin-like peptidase domain-containing protein n=1 Tax=Novosphingobium album (ex Liu et al. 2023) TaxID=3031130 RepID=A0ABT5WQN6_9SPHN|nr:trypsin-like peptidase domain-containing protein [Novosphingobium album (ex Liu et al. 2023)]MDE8652320.1 trypsin-like peptidase domain-containing protein [Novosphingobium album (ex Liu et al. 2023)]